MKKSTILILAQSICIIGLIFMWVEQERLMTYERDSCPLIEGSAQFLLELVSEKVTKQDISSLLKEKYNISQEELDQMKDSVSFKGVSMSFDGEGLLNNAKITYFCD